MCTSNLYLYTMCELAKGLFHATESSRGKGSVVALSLSVHVHVLSWCIYICIDMYLHVYGLKTCTVGNTRVGLYELRCLSLSQIHTRTEPTTYMYVHAHTVYIL